MINLINRKFIPPELPCPYLERKKVLELLKKGIERNKKLTLIHAGPGYGKTAVVLDYIHKMNLPIFWYNLDEIDTDPVIFLTHLIKGVQDKLVKKNLSSFDLLHTTTNIQNSLPNIIGLFTEELIIPSENGLIMVFDDYQTVDISPEIRKIFEYIIQYLPETIQLIIISRYPPNLKIPQLKVRQQLIEITTENLSFSEDEICKLLRLIPNLNLNQKEIQNLIKLSQGWIASIILFITYSKEPSNKKSFIEIMNNSNSIYEYLASEVFDNQSPDIQDFLLKTSILPIIDLEICKIIFDDSIKNKLDIIIKNNLFISKIEEYTDAYQYHPIFQNFLQQLLKQKFSQTQIDNIYLKLGEYWSNSQPYISINYYIEAHNLKKAEETLKSVSDDLLKNSRWDILQNLLDKFDIFYKNNSILLNLLQGEVCRGLGDYDKALTHYQRSLELNKSENNNFYYGRTYSYLSALWGSRGDNEQHKIYAQQALQFLPENDYFGLAFTYNSLGLYYLMMNDSDNAFFYYNKALLNYQKINDRVGQSKVLNNQGLAYTKFGLLDKAIFTYKESIKQAKLSNRYAYPMIYNNLAIIYCYLGKFSESWDMASTGLKLAQELRSKRDEIYLLWTLGFININLGEFHKSKEYFNRSYEEAISLQDKISQAYALNGLSELARLEGKINRAYELIQQAINLRGLPLTDPGMLDYLISLGLIQLEKQDYQNAEKTLLNIHKTLEKLDYRYRLCQVSLYLTKLYRRINKETEYKQYYEQARILAESNNYEYLFKKETTEFEGTIEVKTIPPIIKIKCFGDFEVTIGDRQIKTKEWKGYKTKLIFAYLLQHKKGATKEKLEEIIYGDIDVSRTAILVIITRLRRVLEPEITKQGNSKFILFQNSKYLFNRGLNYWIDTEEFEYLINQLKENNLEESRKINYLHKIIDLYKGDYLSEFSGEYWCQIQSEHYKQQVLECYINLMDYYYKNKKYKKVISISDKNLKIDNCYEIAYQYKIKSFLALGDRKMALCIYKLMEEVLIEELGLLPSEESKNLYKLITSKR